MDRNSSKKILCLFVFLVWFLLLKFLFWMKTFSFGCYGWIILLMMGFLNFIFLVTSSWASLFQLLSVWLYPSLKHFEALRPTVNSHTFTAVIFWTPFLYFFSLNILTSSCSRFGSIITIRTLIQWGRINWRGRRKSCANIVINFTDLLPEVTDYLLELVF